MLPLRAATRQVYAAEGKGKQGFTKNDGIACAREESQTRENNNQAYLKST